jgi:hypothetical protein
MLIPSEKAIEKAQSRRVNRHYNVIDQTALTNCGFIRY